MLFTSANKNEIKNYDSFSQQPSRVTCKGEICLICMETQNTQSCLNLEEKSTSWVSRCWANFDWRKKCKLFIVSKSCFPSSLTSPHTRHITAASVWTNTTKHFPNFTFIHAERSTRVQQREGNIQILKLSLHESRRVGRGIWVEFFDNFSL